MQFNRNSYTSEHIAKNIYKTSKIIVTLSKSGDKVKEAASSLEEQVIVLKQFIGLLQGN